MSKRQAVILLGVLVLAVVLSYGLALAGEPQSVWLWGDVLGVLP